MTRALLRLALEIRQEVVAIEMDFVGHASRLIAGQQLLLDVGHARRCHQRGDPVLMRTDIVHHRSWLDHPRPANNEGNAISTFPARVLLATEGSGSAVGPAHGFGAIVGGEDDDGVVSNTEVIELLQDYANVVVELGNAGAIKELLIDHGLVFWRDRK